MKKARGGARPGAGMPKGYVTAKVKAATMDKEMARARLREIVMANLDPLVHAQVANAQGIRFLMVREKTSGKFVKVGKDAAEKLDPNTEIIEVWEKDPSVQAFTDLMNRAIDKPIEQVEAQVSGNIVYRWKDEE
jgi:isocitrate/isopropylmalate dehydrogenase